MKMLPTLTVTYLDEGVEKTAHDVKADNRDMVRYDLTRKHRGWPEMQEAVIFWRTFLAWSAMNRTGIFPGEFDTFEAIAVEEQDDEAEDLDPTRRGRDSVGSSR